MTADALSNLPRTGSCPDRGKVGIAVSDHYGIGALFTIFVVAYLVYIGKSASGPQPKDVLELPIFSSTLPAIRAAPQSSLRNVPCTKGSLMVYSSFGGL